MSAPFNPLAVVTGASSGIGLELAQQLASNGFDLVVCAADDGLAIAADALRANNVAVETVRVDLAQPGGVRQLVDRVTVTGRPVDALVINAGIGVPGVFVSDSSLAEQLGVVDLNVRSAVHLAKALIPAMAARGSGRVLFTSSAPGPFQTVHNASEAFLLSFSQGLREELGDSGVTVTALVPGLHDDRDDPTVVAKLGYEAMMAGKDHVEVANVLPDTAQHRKTSGPGSADS